MKKRFCALSLALWMCLSLLPLGLFAQAAGSNDVTVDLRAGSGTIPYAVHIMFSDLREAGPCPLDEDRPDDGKEYYDFDHNGKMDCQIEVPATIGLSEEGGGEVESLSLTLLDGAAALTEDPSYDLSEMPDGAYGTVTFHVTSAVTWKDGDGKALKTDTLAYGATPVYSGETPTKTATDQYAYTFTGWDPKIVPVSGNAEYTAQFDSTVNEYTITWKDDEGRIIDTTTVEYGETPTHADAAKPATAQYTYTFTGWDPEIVPVTGPAEYTAQFDSTMNKYTVTWKDGDGKALKTDTLAYGATPVYSGETPTKAATDQYAYTFTGWDPEIVPVTGPAEYTAQFDSTVNKYTITWKDDEGGAIDTTTVEYGATPTHADAAKPATAQYTYTFTGWDPEIVPVTGPAEYTAQFDSTVNKYTITWKDGNGDILKTDQVAYGVKPAYPGDTPTKKSDDKYSYTFAGWTPEITAVTGDATYTASFTSNKVESGTITPDEPIAVADVFVIWKDGDGKTLKTERLAYGETPAFSSETMPTKTATAQYTYTFNNTWLPEPEPVSPLNSKIEYTAQFDSKVNEYTITWKDDEGGAIDTTTVEYGETPTHADAAKPATAQYTYTFTGWDPEIVPVTGDAEYIAQFDRTTRQYTITWKDGNGDILKAEPVAYGETPAYTGDTPTKQDDYLTRFIFNDTWSPEIMPVSGDAVYSAQFDEKKMYPVIFDTNEGSEVPFQSVLAGECAVKPDDPTWSGGNFVQWVYDNDRSVPYDFSTPVTSRVDLTAEWDNANNPYGEAEGCYVATCVYGSYDCPEVWTLRRFRDRVLARTWYGRLFIRTYYAVSPTIVKLVGGTGWFQSFWRARLDRMVASLQGKGFESTPYQDRKW